MEVPDGWVQLIRGPCPMSEKLLLQSRQKPMPAVRQSGAQGSKRPIVVRLATDPVRRVSPDLARVTAQERARKLEKALEVMSDAEGPAVEAIRVELKKAQITAAVCQQHQVCEKKGSARTFRLDDGTPSPYPRERFQPDFSVPCWGPVLQGTCAAWSFGSFEAWAHHCSGKTGRWDSRDRGR